MINGTKQAREDPGRVDTPPPRRRLLIAQMQAAVNRLSMRGDLQLTAMTAMFRLQEVIDSMETAHISTVRRSLADMCVTTVWLADRYCVSLHRAHQDLGYGGSMEDLLDSRKEAFAPIGRAARVRILRARIADINRSVALYEHGYRSSDADRVPPLFRAIPEFHTAVLDTALELGIDISAELDAAFRIGEVESAAEGGHNPPYVSAVRTFEKIARRTYCPYAPAARLWGAPDYDTRVTVEENVRRSVDTLVVFTRVARREGLDALVYAFPAEVFGEDIRHLATLLRKVIATLMTHDPVDPRRLRADEVAAEGWRFSFADEDYFVPVFAPLYPQNHSRYTYEVSDTVFVLLQPDSSFHSRLGADGAKIRKQIRRRFGEGFQPYGNGEKLEAQRFLPAPQAGSPAPVWWEADAHADS